MDIEKQFFEEFQGFLDTFEVGLDQLFFFFKIGQIRRKIENLF